MVLRKMLNVEIQVVQDPKIMLAKKHNIAYPALIPFTTRVLVLLARGVFEPK